MVVRWSVETVDDWEIAGIETQGQQPHDWLRHWSRERTWLFKPARPSRNRSMREDIVEKLGCEIARLLGVPAARVELANRGGTPGALVEDARLPSWELQLGQALMPEVVTDYDPKSRERLDYNIQNIRRALRRFAAPPEATALPAGFGAFDTFAGYLVFDALIAHGDRHARNWAVIRPPLSVPGREALCPSFDHAASLGFTLSDVERTDLMEDQNAGVSGWASRGHASRYEHRKGTRWQTLVDLAGAAVALCPVDTRDYWCDRIMSVEFDSVQDVVAAAPDLTDIARRFTVELVMVNRGRLLNVLR